MITALRRWRLADRADLAGRHCGDAWVWHHGPSNDTHRLSLQAGLLLQALQQGGELGDEALGARAGLQPSEVADVFGEFARMGWVRPC